MSSPANGGSSALRTGAGRDARRGRLLARALLHDDRVGALRHHAAGEDAHALPAPTTASLGLPANDSPIRARLVRDRGRVAEAHREAVHRRVVVRGNGHGDVTSVASTRPSAARRWTRSVPVTGARSVRITARARSTGIEFGS
jgi:hypothetical protein